MFIHPPTRDIRKFAAGGPAVGVSRPGIKTRKQAAALCEAYDAVRTRDDHTCQQCHRPYLEAPNLRLGVKNPESNIYAPRNLVMLCVTCCNKREATLGVTADSVTGIVREAVFQRDASCCVYTDRPMAKNRRTLVPVVDSPDPTNPDDWACSSKEAAKERGPLSHKQYLQVCLDRALSLAGYLMERVEAEE